ncbi:hypothetical protein SAMN05444398_1011084 [Roseovarius pacificus]|uniref:Phosphomannomutase n=1 Tax=Roseovarius pacificus TaxID=337701 RepID=A0A1M6YY51_9RHOB|nr:hypothetical protein [Roseovarius pacificus]GGO50238.1 hypothetical protein GCM10011315_00500 [Roseovarius pacificus]SHL23035.1 hypothetical protein SAMN05444398_1011084 [Roseovarius pacificus]
MFSIEHEFDATVVTLVDDGNTPLQEDVVINAFEECVTVEQYDPRTDTVSKITLSMAQLRDLRAALNLPEGVYTIGPDGKSS